MTDEQPDPYDVARAKVEDALREYVTALGAEDEVPTFLTDWLLIGAAHIDHGEQLNGTRYVVLLREDQPSHASLGLLRREVTKLEAWIAQEVTAGDDEDL